MMVSDFRDILSFVRNERAHIEGDIYIGSKFLITRNCNSFFKLLLDNNYHVKANVVRIAMVERGWCEATVGYKKYHCKPGDLLFINWGATVNDDAFGHDTIFDGFTMTEDFMRMVFGGKLPELFLSPDLCFSIHLDEKEQMIWQQYTQILYSLSSLQSVSDETLNFLFVSVLNYVQSQYKLMTTEARGGWSRNKQVVERFIRLVNENAKIEHEVEFYASELCMTAHYLGMIIKKETGITAKEWIDKTLITLIELELRYSNKSLKMIADEYKFVSLSSLCKFYKRRTGITATAFRVTKS